MGTITRIALGTTAALGLLYVGGVYNLDDKITAAYQTAKHEYMKAGQEYFCPGFGLETITVQEQKIMPETSDLSLYIAGLPADVQGEIFTEMYRGLPEERREDVLAAGFNTLSYDGKLETLDAMAKSFEKEMTREKRREFK
ncbi:hypothetical protein HZC31_03775 [Candidatus Woesearchaeota archaeon]|nr:hypothetical protein [Candidatus Woesearchaeota archaeon]